jgi:hypothetical protein
MPAKGLLQRFDERIVLEDDTTLATLREAIHCLANNAQRPALKRDRLRAIFCLIDRKVKAATGLSR